ncbi:MAG: transcriptional regulator [Verrucomicrobiota bacterium]
MKTSSDDQQLAAARDEFVSQWGAMGSAWGINRTMAQIHALLFTSAEPLSTDEVMADLKISRGNAHSNLRELAGWGLVRSVIRKGERKEYFEAEKDIWQMFCIIARERKRREITPALQALQNCTAQTKGLKSKSARAFHGQLKELTDFVDLCDRLMETVARIQKGAAVNFTLKFLKATKSPAQALGLHSQLESLEGKR